MAFNHKLFNALHGEPRPSVEERARTLWDTFDANERAGVKFGMFPYAKMKAAEKEGYTTHALVVALMLCARVAT